uniref:Uncharacterized protein n=1 Tax=Arundo donax TaxID=35708 RepID=A0A0A9ESP9_ARUDO
MNISCCGVVPTPDHHEIASNLPMEEVKKNNHNLGDNKYKHQLLRHRPCARSP